jgi:site-specific recombinase XerD
MRCTVRVSGYKTSKPVRRFQNQTKNQRNQRFVGATARHPETSDPAVKDGQMDGHPDDALVVLEARGPLPTDVELTTSGNDTWPGVDDAAGFKRLVMEWLSQYANQGTRQTYAYALGLPQEWAVWSQALPSDAATSPPGAAAADVVRDNPRGGGLLSGKPPAGASGALHDLAWFRWCAAHTMDPREATGTHVKAWLHTLEAAGASKRTRQRMLSTLSAFYAYLTEVGAVPANPAALNRTRLGLNRSARDASPTIRLTATQLKALLDAAAQLPNRTRHRDLYAARAVAVVALLTLGLRVSELVGLDRDNLMVSGGEPMLRVLGKGGVHREVYLTELASTALRTYLAERDRTAEATAPAVRGRTNAAVTPLIATRDGGRCSRFDMNALLRRIAVQAGPALADVADRVHPHALRHAYVTIALEHDARIQHIQADVGHASIATTQYYDRNRRTRATTAADLVEAAIRAATPAPSD